MNYNLEWEKDLCYRIARKLGHINTDVGLIFGIFSRGHKTVTNEDFKYCCLNRLNLRKEMTERELDMFLQNNEFTRGKEFMDQEEFIQIFKNHILRARHECLNAEATWKTSQHHSRDPHQTIRTTISANKST